MTAFLRIQLGRLREWLAQRRRFEDEVARLKTRGPRLGGRGPAL